MASLKNSNAGHSGLMVGIDPMRLKINKRQLLTNILACQLACYSGLAFSSPYTASLKTESKLVAATGQAEDRFSSALAIQDARILTGAPGHDGSGAVYFYQHNTYGGGNWSEIAQLVPADSHAGQQFGNSIAINDTTAVIGAIGDNQRGKNAGAAYIYDFQDGKWNPFVKLIGQDVTEGDRFGTSVAIHRNLVVVGAHNHDSAGLADAGAVYLFARDEGGKDNWGQIARLTDEHGDDYDRFGVGVAIEGDTVVIGADHKDAEINLGVITPAKINFRPRFTFSKESDGFCGTDAGSVFVFSRHQNGQDQWGQVGAFTLSDAECSDHIGKKIALSGDTIAVGVPEKDIDDLLFAGRVYMFSRHAGGTDNWGETAIIEANGAAIDDHFGYSVALQGNILAVGAEGDDLNGFGAGSAFIFERTETGIWHQEKRLHASDAEVQDRFGSSIAVTGESVLIGAVEDRDSGNSSGSAYIYHAAPKPSPAADFSFGSGRLSLNAVDVPGMGLFQAALQRVSPDLFTVTEISSLERVSSAVALYSGDAGSLYIPSVEIVDDEGVRSFYRVNMQLVNQSPLQFQLVRVR